jgi:polysaccharide biosynthesis transport protein
MSKLPIAIPEPADSETSGLPARALYRSNALVHYNEPEQRRIPLSHYLWLLRRHLWKIAAFVALAVLTTCIISSRLTPIYESTAIIDIDRQLPTGVVGQTSNPSLDFDSDQFLSTQIRLIQSDSVLRPVAEKYHLIEHNGKRRYASLEEAALATDAPIALAGLRVSRPATTLLLLISYRSADSRLAANVANGVANSYLERSYELRYRAAAGLSSFIEKQLEELKAKMERSGAALFRFERELNVINPEEKTSIISSRLLQLNTEYTTAQTDRLHKEAIWNSVEGGTIESLQITDQSEALKRTSELLSEAQQKFADTKTHFGTNHPEYRKVAAAVQELQQQVDAARENAILRVKTEYEEAISREGKLRETVAQTKAEFDHINSKSIEYQSVKHEADADKQLYEELIRKINEAGINAGFQNGSIRVADPARPTPNPVFPNMKLNAFLAFIFSSLFAVCATLLSDIVDNTVRDPEEVRNLLETDVIGTLPLVKQWEMESIYANNRGKSTVTKWQPTSRYLDSVRALRNSVLLTSLDGMKTLMITSASPSEGKTTTAVNLAIAHARSHHKTLLIDADLRRPGVHQRLGLTVDRDAKSDPHDRFLWQEHLVAIESVPDLYVLPAANADPGNADFIGNRLSIILEEAEEKYDFIIIDSPPMLGFPEPLELSVIVDGVLIIALAGQTDRRALSSVFRDLRRLRANVIGLVLNKVSAQTSNAYYYNSYQYGKYYR